jgi:hypothetical protein
MTSRKSPPVRESTVEKYFVKECKRLRIYQRKWSSPGQRGVPDRILLYNHHWRVMELKAPGKKPTPLQQREHVIIRKHGGVVWVADCAMQVDYFLEKLLSADF